jgi:hypothetical protein
VLAPITSVFREFLFNWACNNPTRDCQTALAAPMVASHAITASREPSPNGSAESDAEDRLTAWEQDRAATLTEAADSEQQGLRLLTRAALLRLHVQFEDEGFFVVAHELRQQADALQEKPGPVAVQQSGLTTAPF